MFLQGSFNLLLYCNADMNPEDPNSVWALASGGSPQDKLSGSSCQVSCGQATAPANGNVDQVHRPAAAPSLCPPGQCAWRGTAVRTRHAHVRRARVSFTSMRWSRAVHVLFWFRASGVCHVDRWTPMRPSAATRASSSYAAAYLCPPTRAPSPRATAARPAGGSRRRPPASSPASASRCSTARRCASLLPQAHQPHPLTTLF